MRIIKIRIHNEEKNINLLNDFLFGKLFGERGCEKETLYLINTFTKRNFKSLSFESNEMKGLYKDNKKSATDVLVMMNDHTIVNIESQLGTQKGFHKRSHFYNSKIYSALLNIGDDYEELPMTIMLNILGFNLHKLANYHTTFVLTEKINREYSLEDIIEIHYIDLTRFRKKVRKNDINLNNPEDRLVLLLDEKTPQNLIDKVIEMDEFANNILKKSLYVLKDKKEYLSYIRAEQAELDRKAQLRYAKEEGMERGMEKGMEKGREEEKIQIAINLKKNGVSIEKIAKSTGFSVESIEKL